MHELSKMPPLKQSQSIPLGGFNNRVQAQSWMTATGRTESLGSERLHPTPCGRSWVCEANICAPQNRSPVPHINASVDGEYQGCQSSDNVIRCGLRFFSFLCLLVSQNAVDGRFGISGKRIMLRLSIVIPRMPMMPSRSRRGIPLGHDTMDRIP